MTRVGWLKIAIFPLCLAPLGKLVWRAATANLGANPIEAITHATGDWTLIFLLVTLAVTPLRKLSGQLWLIRLRRMFGLFVFFYGLLHFLTYFWLDQNFNFHSITKDVYKRPFITAGFTAFVLLIPLAATSTRGMIQRLGGERWQWLHRLIYVSATAGVIHYLWLVKKDISKPLEYASVLGILLAYRILVWFVPAFSTKRKRVSTAASVSESYS
jgi:sulfoxide reductase heme-binding subunit YedZ